ncbi:hypothetical protein CU037_2033 [Enterococcus faecium]|nr:hypothetical protein [Enterococcus faecium]MBK4810376.1 hypothetical protein [Enterococcus faecium]
MMDKIHNTPSVVPINVITDSQVMGLLTRVMTWQPRLKKKR